MIPRPTQKMVGEALGEIAGVAYDAPLPTDATFRQKMHTTSSSRTAG